VELLQQVRAAMDVADAIDALLVGYVGGGGLLWFSEFFYEAFDHGV